MAEANVYLKANPIETITLYVKRFSTVKAIECSITHVMDTYSEAYVGITFNGADLVPSYSGRAATLVEPTEYLRFVKVLGRYKTGADGKSEHYCEPLAPERSVKLINDRLTQDVKLKFNKQGWKWDAELNAPALADLLQHAGMLDVRLTAIIKGFHDKHFNALQAKLDVTYKIQISELIKLVENYDPAVVRDSLLCAGFSKVPKLEDFPKAREDGITCWVGGWEMSRKPDGYGHECGWSYGIDWANRTFTDYGWSSDD